MKKSRNKLRRRYNGRACPTAAERKMLPCEVRRLAIARKAGFSTRFPYDFRYDFYHTKVSPIPVKTNLEFIEVSYLSSCSVRSYATCSTNYDGKSSKKSVLFARNIYREMLKYGFSENKKSKVYQLFFYLKKDRYKNQKHEMIKVGKELIQASKNIAYYFFVLGATINDATVGQPGAGVDDEDEKKGGDLRAKLYKKYVFKDQKYFSYASDVSYKTYVQIMKCYWRFI